ncbi:uncharacterized protein LOC142573940 [Dermacentor variabilis]|uniref:uncharacterized protein LOC142565801 n=1 Tax=Dermacentor variabilis TaxID=34621 RepID=UPI003F5C1FDF
MFPWAALKRILEEYLASDSRMEQMVNFFSRYGGTDTGRAVSTILQGILTNEAALQFSWKGSQGRKHAFVKLMAITNITFVRSTFPDASLASVAGVAKRWLVGAADRDGGRNERRRRDPASSPPNMN